MATRISTALAAGVALLPAMPLGAQPVPRQPPVSGAIVATRSGETAELVPSRTARRAEVRQQLKAGDVLRTNANGTLAIVFADRTQIRLGRNAVLVVREVRAGQPSSLQLQRGRMWGRSPSGSTRLSVETPSATAAIRGTEWALAAEEERTTLHVLDGEVELANEAGSLSVTAGQAATARPGQAPTRIVLVTPPGREQLLYFLSAEEGLAMLSHSARWGAVYRDWFDAAAAGEAPPPPDLDEADSDSWAGRAFLLAWRGELDEALRAAELGLARHPHSMSLHEVKTRIALLMGDRALAERSIADWMSQDETSGAAYAMRAEIALAYLGEPYAALADAERAVRYDNARPASYATLADIRLERDAPQEAAAAIDRAIALSPDDAGLHARRAFILLRQNRVREARRAVERALALDPSLSIVRTALGRYHVQTGNPEQALEELLAASAENPGYARALIALAETFYRAGDEAAALQQLDAADRLDPASPLVPLARTAIALDRYAGDEAIRGAREAMRRFRARGGAYASLSENRTTGSYVSEAFRFLGLEGWGRYYGDRVFDSFTPSSYFDQALNQTASPFIQAPRAFYDGRVYQPFDTQAGEDLDSVSSFVQGLLLDPLSVTASEMTPQFSNERFLEGHAGAGTFVTANRHRLTLFGGADGIVHTPVPFGFSLDVEASQRRNREDTARFDEDPLRATLYFGAEATPADRIVLFGSFEDDRRVFEGGGINEFTGLPTFFLSESDVRIARGFAFWSHSFGARDQLAIGGGAGMRRDRIANVDGLPGAREFVDILGRDSFELASAFYARSFGRADLKAGVELVGAAFEVRQAQAIELPTGEILRDVFLSDERQTAAQERAYADVRLWPRGPLLVQAHAALVRTRDARLVEAQRSTNLDLRLGAAWEPAAGQWLRLALGRNTPRQVPFTLAPSTTLGLRENLLPAFFELLTPTNLAGQVDSAIARWDSEWSRHFFTAIEYQHQRFGRFPINTPDAAAILNGDNARIDRLSASANLWATGNVGIALAGAWTRGRIADPDPQTQLPFLPFLPRWTGKASVVWTTTARTALRLTANYVGEQRGFTGATLDDYVVANAAFEWEPFNRRVAIRVEGFNLLDSDIRVSEAIIRGPGRALQASARVRF